MSKFNQRKKIIIVGAGIAGLAASDRLASHGFDVVTLEARHRYGGRIDTNNSMGVLMGLGANWIHGIEENPIFQLAKNTNVAMVEADPEKYLIYDGKANPIPHEEISHFKKKFDALLNKAKEIAFSNACDTSLASALSPIINQITFSPTEKALFKSELISMESYIGANYQALSARHWDQEESLPGANCFLTSSYQPIVDSLSKSSDIKLNTIVKEINMRENIIEITTNNITYLADAVIVTVPLGVLKRNLITFNPPLPEYKLKSIQRLDMGLFNITALKFPHSFWPNENHALFYTQFDDASLSVFFNLHHYISEPILLGFSGGNVAKKLETFTDEQIILKTMDNFKKIYGANIPDPITCLNTRWSQDPYSYGSYSYIPVAASGEDYDSMSKPVLNRLFFAGEATSSKYPATTHGAYLSGVREANNIIKLLNT